MAGSFLCPAAPTAGLDELFRVSRPQGDVVVLLDASLSMRKAYPAVREAAIGFASGLTGTEYLHMRAFAGVPTVPLEGRGDQTSRLVADHLPANVLSGGTDLGLALEKAMDFLERANASPVQGLFLLTDGRHEPPKGSPYSRDFDHDPSWQRLRERAHALCRRKAVRIYGVGLNQQTDINLLLRIFPARNVELAVSSPPGVNGFLSSLREGIHLEQLRQAVREELNTGKVELVPKSEILSNTAQHAESVITIRNLYGRLSIRLAGITCEQGTGEPAIHASLKDTPDNAMTLEPGQELKIGIAAVLQTSLPKWHLGRATRTFQAQFWITPNVVFENQAELKRLGFDPISVRVAAIAVPVRFGVAYGIPITLVAVMGLIALAWLIRLKVVQRQWKQEKNEQWRAREALKILNGRLRIAPANSAGDAEDFTLHNFRCQRLVLSLEPSGRLAIAAREAVAEESIVATLSGGISTGPRGQNLPEYRLEVIGSHSLGLESAAGFIPTTGPLILCDSDVFEIDGKWRLRYSNDRLRRRFVSRSS